MHANFTQTRTLLKKMNFLLCFSVCQDLQDEILCSEAKKAGNCEQMPWNGKCRKTCGRCGTFIKTLQGLKEEWGGVGRS